MTLNLQKNGHETIHLTAPLKTSNLMDQYIRCDLHGICIPEDDSQEFAYKILHEKSKSFYFATMRLPEQWRTSTAILYAICRIIDDIADEPTDQADEQISQLKELSEFFRNINSKFPCPNENQILFQTKNVILEHEIPVSLFVDLIDGALSDLKKVQYKTTLDLMDYCYRVAGTVGLMMTHLFVSDPSEEILMKARRLGEALQLINILRDVKEDFLMERIYLPSTLLKRFNVDLKSVISGYLDSNYVSLLKSIESIAKDLFREGMEGIYLLPEFARYPIGLAANVYLGILEEIAGSGYDNISARRFVPKWKKMVIAVRWKFALLFKNSFKLWNSS